MAAYYDEHVEADAVHELLAAHDICGTLAEDEPDQAAEILFGAWACLDLEARLATALFESWGVERMTDEAYPHPDVVLQPHGPMLVRGATSVQAEDGTVHARRASGRRAVPLRQVEPAAVVRRHAQGDPAPLAAVAEPPGAGCQSAARAALAPAAPCTPPPGCAEAEARKRPGTPVAARPRIAGTGRKTSSWWSWEVPPLTAPPTRLALRASSSRGPSTRRATDEVAEARRARLDAGLHAVGEALEVVVVPPAA